MSVSSLKQPGAFIPFTMSIAALLTVLYHLATFGTARQPDEGAAAHIWQLLMAGQLPVVAFFAIKWLPQAPRSALQVLSWQFVAGPAAPVSVFLVGGERAGGPLPP